MRPDPNARALERPALALLLALTAGAAGAQTGDSGIPHYARDRPVDFLDMRLAMTFTEEDIRARRCEGRVEYTMTPRARATSTVVLDAVDLEILGVETPGETGAPEFAYDDERLTVRLPREIAPGERFQLAVRYRVEDPFRGLHFTLPSGSAPGKPVAVYTQGEPLQARYWVPAHDWPNERWTSEIAVTVPDAYNVVANGVLLSRTVDESGAATFTWKNGVPTISHHLGFVFGDLVELEDRDTRSGKPVKIYAQRGREDEARATFRRVPDMLDFFSELLGEDLPYPGYAMVTAAEHFHGGMEHAGYSLLDTRALTTGPEGEAPPYFLDAGIIAHMAAHQWFGGVVNYRSLPQAWLNEGFASYLHMLWIGRRDSPDDFELELWRTAHRVARSDTSESGRPMADLYVTTDDVFSFDGLKIYWKGAWVLHMLRRELGDELFWQGVRAYLDRHRFDSAESSDLRHVLSSISGLDLERFFRQWVHGRGVPRLEASYAWDPAARKAHVTVAQTQKIDADTPAFVFPLELYFRAGEDDVSVTVEVEKPRHELTYDFASAPAQFVVDPRQRLLKTVSVDLPRSLLIEQARRGPTTTARLDAVEALAEEARPEAARALADVLADPAAFWGVRAEAAEGLGRMQRDEALDGLLRSARTEHPRVRAAVREALGHYPLSAEAHEILLEDEDADVEAAGATISSLGNMRSRPELVDRSVERLRAAVAPSSRRWVRQRALAAIRELGDPRLFDTVLAIAQPGRDDDLRSAAIRTLGIMGARTDVEPPPRETLTRWLDDPDRTAQRAAATALGQLGDAEALADLHRLAESARGEEARRAARDAMDAIRQGAGAKAAAAVAAERIDELEEQGRALEEKLTELERRLESLVESEER
jgi:aminopeptidase N